MTLRRRPSRLALLLALAGCTEQVTAPGVCPDFCPGGQITVVDTLFSNIIGRDSAFTGYLEAYQAEELQVADLPGAVDSRAIMLMSKSLSPLDSTIMPIIVDSSWVSLRIVRRDTATKNLRVKLYRLPITIDSTTTFADVAPAFADLPVDSVNVDSLLARPLISDTQTVRIWGDTIRTDSAGHVLQVVDGDSSLILYFVLDTLQAPFIVADSGQLAFGVRVAADTLASIALGSNNVVNRDATIRRYFHYEQMIDSITDSTVYTFRDRETVFGSFVFDPPTPSLDSNLAVGGAPAARSLLRMTIPEVLRDSADVVRATLILVPVGPVPGAAGDAFTVLARPVIADLGAKSPLNPDTAFDGRTRIPMNTADTVRIEVTDLIRSWARDTTAAAALMLGQLPEASSFSQIRFYSTRTPAFKPALHVTYVRRYAFGTP